MSDTHRKLILTALKKGDARRGNYDVHKEGEYVPVWTFTGIEHIIKGHVICEYFGTPVVAIDFLKEAITDFGMDGYSVTTSQNISRWSRALHEIFPSVPDTAWWNFQRYTSYYRDVEGEPGVSSEWSRFLKRVSWVGPIDRWMLRSKHPGNARWFFWRKFDKALDDLYVEGRVFLAQNQNWRYFKHDWDEKGNWVRSFINADAQRKWHARERRRLRQKAA